MIKLSLGQLTLHNIPHHALNLPRRGVGHRLHRGLAAVRQHYQRRLSGLRNRPRITVVLLTHRCGFDIRCLGRLHRLVIKAFYQAGAVVLLNNVNNFLRQLITAGNISTLLGM